MIVIAKNALEYMYVSDAATNYFELNSIELNWIEFKDDLMYGDA